MVESNPLGEKLHLTIKHCFEKCGFPTDNYVATAQDSDEEFEIIFNEISDNFSIDEYFEVDNTLATSEEVDVSKIGRREKLRNEYIEEVLKVETASSDLEDEDEYESQENSSSNHCHFLIKWICLVLMMKITTYNTESMTSQQPLKR